MPDKEVAREKIKFCRNCRQRIDGADGDMCLDCRFELVPTGDNFPFFEMEVAEREVQCR